MKFATLYTVVPLALSMKVYHGNEVKSIDSLENPCLAAVGFKASRANNWCREECETYYKARGTVAGWLESDRRLAESCYFQHFITGVADAEGGSDTVLDPCFDASSTYSLENIPKRLTLLKSNVETPAMCQALCQEKDIETCARFAYMQETKDCYAFNKKQGMTFTLDRSYVVNHPELGDDLCPNKTSCKKLKCFSIFQGTYDQFDGKVISGWRWCHPNQTPCDVQHPPITNRFVTIQC